MPTILNELSDLQFQVQQIISEVKNTGNEALRRMALRFDHVEMPLNPRIEIGVLEKAYACLNSDLKEAIEKGIQNIRAFHRTQRTQLNLLPFTMEGGGKSLSWQAMPLYRAGVYVPGGDAAYPSTVLMNCIPAQEAGVSEIAVFTPPTLNEEQKNTIYGTCFRLGIREVYAVGGAQAIAAAAYGTETIKAVDIITGPGNRYVTEAKRQVVGTVKIDMLAGPSELAIVIDQTSNLAYVAADLLAQAEHDRYAKLSVVAIANPQNLSINLRERLQGAIKDQLIVSNEQNAALAIENLEWYACNNAEQAIDKINALAPEHLSLQYENCKSHTASYQNYGTLFVGPYTPEAIGDYCAGTNHVLPTMGTARFESALSVMTYMRFCQQVEYSKSSYLDDLDKDRKSSMLLAKCERLPYHERSMAIRLNANENPYNGKFETLEPHILYTYPDSKYTQLKTEILKHLQARGEIQTRSLDQIEIGNGSDELLDQVVRALTQPGDKILTLEPSFSEYKKIINNNRCSLVNPTVNLAKGMAYTPVSKLIQSIILEQPQLIILCNPNNPTGQKFSKHALTKIEKVMPSNCILVLDEAYYAFSHKALKKNNFRGELPYTRGNMGSNIVHVRTLSKSHGLAGLRLGYMLAAPALLDRIRPFLATYRVNHAANCLAIKRLQELPVGEIGLCIHQILVEKKRMFLALTDRGWKVKFGAGNFLWVMAKEEYEQGLIKGKIEIRKFEVGIIESTSDTNLSLEGFNRYWRISIGQPNENTELLNVL